MPNLFIGKFVRIRCELCERFSYHGEYRTGQVYIMSAHKFVLYPGTLKVGQSAHDIVLIQVVRACVGI